MVINVKDMDWLNKITEQMTQAIEESKLQRNTYACCTFNTNDGYIDIWCDRNDSTEVVIYQHNNKGREHPNIEDAVTEAIPLWDEVDVDIEEEPHSDWVKFYGRI